MRAKGRRRTRATLGGLVVVLLLLIAAPAEAVQLKAGQVVVTDAATARLILVDPTSGKQTLLSSNEQPVNASSQLLAEPTDVVMATSGRLLVSDYAAFGTGGVIAVDPATGKQTKLSANDQAVNSSSQLFSSPSGIALAPSGQILVLDRSAFGGNGGVIGVDPATGKESELSSNLQPVNASSMLFTDPRGGIALARNGEILVADASAFDGDGGVISVDPVTGKQSKLSANDQPVNDTSKLFGLPQAITVSATGGLYVADNSAFDGDGGVIGVDPASGKERKVSGNDLPVNASSKYFVSPGALQFSPDGRLLVADSNAFSTAGCGLEGCGGVIAVAPATGKEAILSNNEQAINAATQLFKDPSGLLVVPPRCQGKLATIVGTSKGEKIVGTAGADVISALGGKDKIASLGANDRVCGGPGADLIRGGKGRDRLRGEAGRDGLFGGAGRDLLVGGKGRDKLRGGPGRDRQKQ